MTTQRTRRVFALGVAACAVAALGAWFWRGMPDTADQAQVADSTENATNAFQSAAAGNASASGSTRNSRTGAASNAPPLPSTDLPLRDTFGELKRRAEQGDPRASCRLAMELDYCSSLHDWTRRIERQASRRPVGLPGMSQQDLRDYVANLQEWTDKAMQLSPHCEGVPVASSQERMQHWRAAALGGHVPAMTHYAIGSGFNRENTLQDLTALGIYRMEAETMARRAAAAGDPLALMALISAYMPDPSHDVRDSAMRNMSEFGFVGYLQQAVRKDLVEAMALVLLGRQAYAGDDAPKTARELAKRLAKQIEVLDGLATPEQRLQARQRMQELRSEWAPIDPRESAIGPPLFSIFGAQGRDKDNFSICETGRRPPRPVPATP